MNKFFGIAVVSLAFAAVAVGEDLQDAADDVADEVN